MPIRRCGVRVRGFALISWPLVTMTVQCTNPPRPMPMGPGLASASTTASSSESVVVTPRSSASVSPRSVAPVASSAPVSSSSIEFSSNASQFRCGSSSCRVRDETCCGAGDEGICVPTSPDDKPGRQTGYLRTQWEVCEKAPYKDHSSMDHIDRCDESLDCPNGHLCCEQFLFSGGQMAECTPVRTAGVTPCDFGELCRPDSPCRLAGTTCVDGHCEKQIAPVSCGAAPCPAGMKCCGSPLGCATSCAKYGEVKCTKHSDCLNGQRCVTSSFGAECSSYFPDPEHASTVCDRDADCPQVCRSTPRARAKCVPSPIPWLKVCECP